jgi:glycosyltransferase involved in cell wall biosynthesis
MYELTRRTSERYRYVLFEVVPSDRDPFEGTDQAPLADVVDEVHRIKAPVGGAGQLRRWTRAIPALERVERRIAREIAKLPAAVTVVHHQRFLQAPALMHHVACPTLYVAQEPRRRSFEYDLRHPKKRGALRRIAELPLDLLDAWARHHDLSATRAATEIVCNSQYSRETIWRSYGRDATIIPFGADKDLFVLPTDNARDPEVLAVGSLDPSKGHDLAIAAIAQIPESIRPRLRIVHNRSAPGYADSIMAAATELGVDLSLESGINDSALVERYQRAAAVIATARLEPLGLTPLEAMACGTPVVAVNEGGYRETITPGVTGALVDRSPAALSEALCEVLRSSGTTNRAAIRDHAAKSWSWDLGAERYASVLDGLVDQTIS